MFATQHGTVCLSRIFNSVAVMSLLGSTCMAADAPSPADGQPAAAAEPSVSRTVATDENRQPPPTHRDRVGEKVRRCMATYYRRPLSAAALSPWEVMHAAVGYGVDANLYVDGRRVNALGWLCWNGRCRGQRLLQVWSGELAVRQGGGLEGHDGQFLSVLALSRVPADYEIRVGGYRFTVSDLVEQEKRSCRAGSELTFKLIGLSHYLDSDEIWRGRDGQAWSISRLLREEMDQPVVGAACGGTHRMMGFGYAVRQRARRGEPMVGQWGRARRYVEDFHEYTFKLQNSDGSFSTNWFAGRGDWGDAARRLETTGHTLEWLVLSLPQARLHDPQVVRSVEYLADLLLAHQRTQWGMGPLGHALHALSLYEQRVYGLQPGERDMLLRTPQPVALGPER